LDPGIGLEGHGKPRSPQGFDLRTVEPAASRYTDYAINVGIINMVVIVVVF